MYMCVCVYVCVCNSSTAKLLLNLRLNPSIVHKIIGK